jgi:glycosyltransferase involved in cell wall biosynthesis
MKSKKIFFVADAKSIHTVKWVDYFVDKNYDVYLATFAKINNTKCKNIYFIGKKDINVKGSNYHYLFSIFKLANIFKQIKPDVINAHYSYSLGFIALLAKKISKIKCSYSVVCHGSDVLDTPKPKILFDLINKYIFINSDKILAVSDQIKDKINEFGIDLSKVFVGQYGLVLDNNVNKQKDIDILSNRAYADNSRIEFILEALEAFRDKGLNIVFVLPNIPDNIFKKFIKKYNFIKFYKYVEYSEMIDMMARTKIYISATKSDGTSLSLLESLKYNCFPIVSNIVSNRSWILDGINGFLFDTKEELLVKLEKAIILRDKEIKEIRDINIKLLKQKSNYIEQMKKIERFLTR